jgi:mannose-1-phosphate guanylyltransferase
MIPIVNKPVMEFLVEHLRRFNINKIMVNTSYMAPQIEHYFGDGKLFGVEMAYSFEGREENGQLIDEALGSAGAIRKIHQHSKFFDDTFVVLCGDAVIDLDFDALLNFHRESKALATIALREVTEDEVHNYGIVVSEADGLITEFQEKPSRDQAKSRMANTGIYIFEPEILKLIPEEGAYDIGSQLFPKLAELGGLYGTAPPKQWQWLDIGRVPDFHEVSMKALKGDINGFNMPGREVSPGVWMGLNVKIDLSQCDIVPPVFIGGSAEVKNLSRLIGPVVIGAGAVIEEGAHLEECVVMEHTRVGGNAYFKRKIVGDRYCADADGTILDGHHTDTSWLFADARSRKISLNEDQEMILNLAQLHVAEQR